MNTLLRMIVCFVAISGSVFADTTAKQKIDKVLRMATAADVIIVDDLSPKHTERRGVVKNGVMVWTDLPPPIRQIRITNRENLRQFSENLKLSEDYLRPGEDAFNADGKKITIYPLCQCMGEFRCRFLSNGKELVQFTIHHEGGFIRVTLASTEHEFDILSPFGSALHEQLKAEMHKANHPPM